MSITFTDLKEATEYSRQKSSEGYDTKITPKSGAWKVSVIGKINSKGVTRETVPISKFSNKSWGSKIAAPIDKEIANIIVALNDKGYFTYSSCAGHYKKKWAAGNVITDKYGWIHFEEPLSKEQKADAIKIAKQYGLTNIAITDEKIENGIITMMTFDPSWKRKEK